MLIPLDVCNMVQEYVGSSLHQLGLVRERLHNTMNESWYREHALRKLRGEACMYTWCFAPSLEIQQMRCLYERLWDAYIRRMDAEYAMTLQF